MGFDFLEIPTERIPSFSNQPRGSVQVLLATYMCSLCVLVCMYVCMFVCLRQLLAAEYPYIPFEAKQSRELKLRIMELSFLWWWSDFCASANHGQGRARSRTIAGANLT